jgi:hypothetical protein
MQTTYFRINKKEYCHINDEYIFIVNTKEPTRIPLAHELGEGWGVLSILNYIVFAFLFIYTAMAITFYGFEFFIHPINYGALILLLVSFVRVKEGFLSSRTPMIERKKIKNVLLKSPRFSFPRLVIYFDGPEGKVVRRIIPILYKKEALPVLEAAGLLK